MDGSIVQHLFPQDKNKIKAIINNENAIQFI